MPVSGREPAARAREHTDPARTCTSVLLDGVPGGAGLERLVQGPIWALAIVRAPDGRRVAGMAGVPHAQRGRCCAPDRLTASARSRHEPAIALGSAVDMRFDAASEPAGTWADLLASDDTGEAAIGLAVVNALLAMEPAPAADLDGVAWLLDRADGRDVAVVGHFPFADRALRRIARHVWIIEREPTRGEYGSAEATAILARAEFAVITGSAVANHTIDSLLAAVNPAASVLVLGPSTPLAPALFDLGIDALSGVHVDDVDAVADGLAAGDSFRRMAGLRRVTLLRASV